MTSLLFIMATYYKVLPTKVLKEERSCLHVTYYENRPSSNIIQISPQAVSLSQTTTWYWPLKVIYTNSSFQDIFAPTTVLYYAQTYQH